MAFLDNAGDIILDAVLTDAGRQRLARGNFKIVKFALGDEEINYELFNSSHPSGSAFYDLEIMQTPILEAFTNNTSLMKSKLVSINRNNILYMPVLRVNNRPDAKCKFFDGFDGYYLTADDKTSNRNGANQPQHIQPGIMHGITTHTNGEATKWISIDQGIVTDGNTDGLSVSDSMPQDMLETAFLVRVDHRLLRLHAWDDASSTTGNALLNQFVDDDAIATYFFAQNDGSKTVKTNSYTGDDRGAGGRPYYFGEADASDKVDRAEAYEMFQGPLGNYLRLIPKVAPSIEHSSTLFDKIGSVGKQELKTHSQGTMTIAADGWKYIDTSINVTGVTTGYSVDLPIRIIKGITF